MPKYNKASAIFKQHNIDLYDWLLDQAKQEDISVSAFIIRSLKKIREMHSEQAEQKNNDQ